MKQQIIQNICKKIYRLQYDKYIMLCIIINQWDQQNVDKYNVN